MRQKLSELAALLVHAVQRLHPGGCTVIAESPRARFERHLTATQLVETRLQYIFDMKGLVVKCREEDEDGIAEVIAFPRTLFEQSLNAHLGDSGDEEQDDVANDVDEQEKTCASAGSVFFIDVVFILMNLHRSCVFSRTHVVFNACDTFGLGPNSYPARLSRQNFCVQD